MITVPIISVVISGILVWIGVAAAAGAAFIYGFGGRNAFWPAVGAGLVSVACFVAVAYVWGAPLPTINVEWR